MDKEDYKDMKDKIERYENFQRSLKNLKVARNDFVLNTPFYVENREWGYKFTTRAALSKFRMSVIECMDIELKHLEDEMEGL